MSLYPPESSSTWVPRPVPHPMADAFAHVAASLFGTIQYMWPTREHYRDNRPIPVHLKHPGWKFGGAR